MSVSEPAMRSQTEVRARANDSFRRDFRETKPSFMTTEFWAMLAGIVALVVIYNAAADTSLDLFRATMLGTALAVGYIISRGFAKSGARDETWRDDRVS
jgi:hypothetical protein